MLQNPAMRMSPDSAISCRIRVSNRVPAHPYAEYQIANVISPNATSPNVSSLNIISPNVSLPNDVIAELKMKRNED